MLGALKASLTVYFHTFPPPLAHCTPLGPLAAEALVTVMPPES